MNEKTSRTGAADQGRLFVIAAPSGAGKTTLVHRLMDTDPALRFSVSYTTRPKRRGEVNGRDYHFVEADDFQRMAADGEFLEHAMVFDHRYATSRSQVDELLRGGNHVMLEIDWQGARQVRENMPEACTIFILPPSLAQLEARLRGRSTDPEAVIQRRLRDARSDMAHWAEFDYVVINDDLNAAVKTMQAIIAGRNTANLSTAAAIGNRLSAILEA
jgi:guanylate kinase